MIRVGTVYVIAILSFSIIFADDPCRFEYPGVGVIDLSTIGRTDGNATFTNWDPGAGSNYVYSYNPCKPFTEGYACQNVAACQVGLNGKPWHSLAFHREAIWIVSNETISMPMIWYRHGEDSTFIYLECSTTGEETLIVDDDESNVFKFFLKHKCACWNGCSNTTQTTSSIKQQ